MASEAYHQATRDGWTFDGFMSDGGWDFETEGHIPDVVFVRDLMALYAAKAAGTEGRALLYWPGPGPVTRRFLARGFAPESLLATFINDKWLQQHQRSMPTVPCFRLPDRPRPFDMRTHGPFKVVDLVLSLQFELPRERPAFFAEAFGALEEGGLLILCEKVRQGEALERFYFDFKRGRGVPEEVICMKQRSLFFSMITLSSRWYLRALAVAGFRQVSVLYARAGFVVLAARKGKRRGGVARGPGLAELPLPAQSCAPLGQAARGGQEDASWQAAMVQLAVNCRLGTAGKVLLFGAAPTEAGPAYEAGGWAPALIRWAQAGEVLDEAALRPLSVVQATHALRQERPDERLRLLFLLYASLQPGGLLLLLERTCAPEEMRDLEREWSQVSCGEEAGAAEEAGGLPTAQWYEDALDEAGFVEVAIATAWCGRVLWVARRPRETEPAA